MPKYYQIQQYAFPIFMIAVVVLPYVFHFNPFSWYLGVTAGNLHGLGVTEHRPAHEHEHGRQDDRAEGVDVLERVQRQAARRLGRGIPQLVGGESAVSVGSPWQRGGSGRGALHCRAMVNIAYIICSVLSFVPALVLEEHEVQVDKRERGQEHHVEIGEQLAVGEGVDLLLYLVSRQKVDIGAISITEIADQYLEEVSRMDSLDLDVASDFLLVENRIFLRLRMRW